MMTYSIKTSSQIMSRISLPDVSKIGDQRPEGLQLRDAVS